MFAVHLPWELAQAKSVVQSAKTTSEEGCCHRRRMTIIIGETSSWRRRQGNSNLLLPQELGWEYETWTKEKLLSRFNEHKLCFSVGRTRPQRQGERQEGTNWKRTGGGALPGTKRSLVVSTRVVARCKRKETSGRARKKGTKQAASFHE